MWVIYSKIIIISILHEHGLYLSVYYLWVLLLHEWVFVINCSHCHKYYNNYYMSAYYTQVCVICYKIIVMSFIHDCFLYMSGYYIQLNAVKLMLQTSSTCFWWSTRSPRPSTARCLPTRVTTWALQATLPRKRWAAPDRPSSTLTRWVTDSRCLMNIMYLHEQIMKYVGAEIIILVPFYKKHNQC